jgi:hypothetical protein
MLDDTVAADHDCGSGRSRQIVRALYCALHGLWGKAQVAVTRLFDGLLVHGFSFQSSSTG